MVKTETIVTRLRQYKEKTSTSDQTEVLPPSNHTQPTALLISDASVHSSDSSVQQRTMTKPEHLSLGLYKAEPKQLRDDGWASSFF